MNILKIKDPQGNWVDIPALKGDKGDKGDPGISPTIDSTLSQANQAADAKAVGDKIDEITLTIDETLTQSGQVADAKVTGDALNTKADQNGYYENLNVGVADQLASKNYIEDNEVYTFRPTGGGAKVGTREFDTIVGGSIVWNQYANVKNVSFLADKQVSETVGLIPFGNNTHKYIITWTQIGNLESNVRNTMRIGYPSKYISQNTIDNYNLNSGNYAWFPNVTTLTNGQWLLIFWAHTPSNDYSIDNVQCYDLTQMFGSEIADYIYNLEQTISGAGVAWFRKYFSKDYYEYNAGELMHVSDLQSHDMVGFNLFNKNAESHIEASYRIFDINPIAETNSVSMELKVKDANAPLPSNCAIGFVKKEPIKTTEPLTFNEFRWVYNDGTLKNRTYNLSGGVGAYGANLLPRLIIYPSNEATLNAMLNHFDICIHLVWSKTRDGEYEPYAKHSYPLDPNLTLRGIPKLTDGHLSFDGDIYKPDGTVKRRYEIVTLNGSESWLVNSVNSGLYYITLSASTGIKSNGKIFSNKFISTSDAGSAMTDGQMKIASTNINFKTPYATLEEWKDALALNPVIVIYELAIPTTEQAQPYRSPQIIDPYGTEEYVTTSIIPVGHQTQYPEDLRAKIESLPWDFANLIAPVEITYIATRNYTSGSLFIIDNILYKATANIANGGTITPNTNCTPTTLAEIIAAL